MRLIYLISLLVPKFLDFLRIEYKNYLFVKYTKDKSKASKYFMDIACKVVDSEDSWRPVAISDFLCDEITDVKGLKL